MAIGLHLTTTASGFPIIAITDTAKVNEKTILDQTTPTLIQRNIGYIVADDGYTDLDRIEQLAKQGGVTHHTSQARDPQERESLRAISQSTAVASLSGSSEKSLLNRCLIC